MLLSESLYELFFPSRKEILISYAYIAMRVNLCAMLKKETMQQELFKFVSVPFDIINHPLCDQAIMGHTKCNC